MPEAQTTEDLHLAALLRLEQRLSGLEARIARLDPLLDRFAGAEWSPAA